uniref:S phase cyclin A-associated protein in the endoplasmic reticulum isoform X2 n=1 Tax=Ciona intestinalis TaxID=7719 RepID=UPI00089DD052|nr:S phase cyclin A-associated protein in the endoplasmic reticulum isoform X2 [Ciona intestinalis]|eukprot:XP_018670953.1 S phase cyclin A-associated protein in the endoplasmic reticulum isoform X2 [Ciona intestinalis]
MLEENHLKGGIPLNSSTNNLLKNKSSSNQYAKQRPRPVTVEKVRMIMEEEGRSARNLVSWNIPVDHVYKGKKHKKRETTNRDKRSQSHVEENNLKHHNNSSGDHTPAPPRRSTSGSRRPVSIRARYWAYLFENLRRAVDEIYATCEVDASIVECKEVLLIIDNYRHEFQALIEWINLQERLENAGDHDRPTSLAWEVRKSSPGRPRHKTRGSSAPRTTPRATPGVPINRCLTYAACNPPERHCVKNAESANNESATWAQRVKGVTQQKRPVNNKPTVNGDGDESGWETVSSRRPRHPKYNLSPNEEGKPPTREPSSYVNMVVDRMMGVGGRGGYNGGNTVSSGNLAGNTVNIGNTGKSEDAGNTENNITAGKKTAENNIGNTGNGVESDAVVFSDNWYEGKDVKEGLEIGKILFQGDDGEDTKETSLVENKDLKTDENLQNGVDGLLGNSSLEQLHKEEETLARTLCEEHSVSIAEAEETERDLMRQLREVEEVDTDCESARSSSGAKELKSFDKNMKKNLDWSEFMAKFEAEEIGADWCDLVEEEELREPGRAVQMHEKLSSPSRRRTPAESKRRLEEKHRRAEERRLQMHHEKSQKIHELSGKVQEVVSWKNDLIRRQRVLLQSSHIEKLQRAEEQRAMQLLSKVRKAQAEDTKVNEIAFINELQEQNKRHEVLMRIGEHEERLQELEDERNKMNQVKSAKEENVKERRRALEKVRQDRMEELKVRRKEQDARIEQQRIDKEKEREKMAKEKARERQQRLSALNAAQQEAVSELQKKIQLKHDESERRHQEQLEQRKGKAQELSLGKFSSVVATSPHVTSCDKVDQSIETTIETTLDLENLVEEPTMTSPRQQQDEQLNVSKEELLKIEERRKTMKKRSKKIRTRMATRAKEYLKRIENKKEETNNKSRIGRLLKEVNRLLTNQQASSGPWPTNKIAAFDRAIGDINRTLEKQNPLDQSAFRTNRGFETINEIFDNLLKQQSTTSGGCDVTTILPDKSISAAALCFHHACHGCHDNAIHVLYSNKMTSLVDLLLVHLTRCDPGVPRTNIESIFGCVPPSLLRGLSTVVGGLAGDGGLRGLGEKDRSFVRSILMTSSNDDVRKAEESYLNRGLDVVSYIVSIGLLDTLSKYLSVIRHEVAPASNMAAFIEHSLAFLESVTSFVTMRNRFSPDTQLPVAKSRKKKSSDRDSSTSQWDNDPTQLLPTLEHTELMGIISVLYGLLLHGAPERPTVLRSTKDSNESHRIAPRALIVASAVIKVLNAVALMDLPLLQSSLGADGVSLEYRHICTYLLWYCEEYKHTQLLHDTIVCVGFFTILNTRNQGIVDTGAQPTILQQLCLLPFNYFSNKSLMNILFPTLISCCHHNEGNFNTLEKEASGSLLAGYIENFLEEKNLTEESSKRNEENSNPIFSSPLFNLQFLQTSKSYFARDVTEDNDVTENNDVIMDNDVTMT